MRESANINKKSNSNPATSAHSPLYSRPLAIPRVQDSKAVPTQEDIENQQYQQDKIETTNLETQAEFGSITPEGKERLTVLQAKMADFRQQLLNKPIYANHDFSQIPVHHPDKTLGQVIQPRLTIGAPGDRYEQEADRVATEVVNRINSPVVSPLRLQSINENQQHDVMLKLEPLQLKHPLQQQGSGSTDATPNLEASIQQARGNGQPIADNIREPMEQALGADFSRVRVHTDAKSDEMNQSIQAKAFTTGQDIFFREGVYEPGSRGGQKLIAHELTHVVQQNGAATSIAQGQLQHDIVTKTSSVSERGGTIQRLKADDFKTGAASGNKALKEFNKNQYWEIGFRKLSKVKPGTFDVNTENNKIIKLQTVHIKEGIPLNHSIEGIAISRNADFVMDVLQAGNQKVVVIVAIPPNFGIDMEAEYLKYYLEHPDSNRPGKIFPPEYEQNQSQKLSMEVTMQRVPAGCIYGWIERNQDESTNETVLKYVENPKRACPKIEEVDDQERFSELMSKVKQIKNVRLENFPT